MCFHDPHSIKKFVLETYLSLTDNSKVLKSVSVFFTVICMYVYNYRGKTCEKRLIYT